MPETSRIVPSTIARALLIGSLALAAWITATLATRGPVRTDSGIFAAGGQHLIAGKVLYRDAWDSKPPMVFFLNAAALSLGDAHIDSVRTMERSFAVVGALAVFFIVLGVFGGDLLAFAAGALFLFHFYSGGVWEGGNATEEYAAIFALLGILSVARSVRRVGRPAMLLAGLAGVCFSLAAQTKEPFLLGALPWMTFLVLRRGPEGTASRLARLGTLTLGLALPFLAFVVYFLAHGALGEWLDSIAYHLPTTGWTDTASPAPAAADIRPTSGLQTLVSRLVGNARPAGDKLVLRMPITTIGCLLGLVVTWLPNFRARYGWIPAVAIAALCLDYLGTLISPRQYGHYYLQMVGSFVLVASAGLAWLRDRLRTWRPFATPRLRLGFALGGIVAMVAIVVWVLDQDLITSLRSRFSRPAQQPPSAIATHVRSIAQPSDRLWATSGENSRYYLATGLLSPTRYLFVYDHVFVDTPGSSADDKRTVLREELDASPPRFVIVSRDTGFLVGSGLMEWIDAAYTDTGIADPNVNSRGGEARLYLRNQDAPDGSKGRTRSTK